MNKKEENCSLCLHWNEEKCSWKKALIDSHFNPEEYCCNLFILKEQVNLTLLMSLAKRVFNEESMIIGETKLKRNKNEELYFVSKDEDGLITTIRIFVGSEKQSNEIYKNKGVDIQ